MMVLLYREVDTRKKKIYIYILNPVESNHRDGPTGHNNKLLINKIYIGLLLIFLLPWVVAFQYLKLPRSSQCYRTIGKLLEEEYLRTDPLVEAEISMGLC